jgi:DNA-binding transcriptional MocR family regulator
MTNIWRPELGDSDPPLYLGIARALALDVARGALRPGDRLPPQRELADALGISLGTVTRAYAEAERRGLVKGTGRRGTLVTGRASPPGLSALVGSRDLIDLAANHPTASLDPDLSAALKAVARRSDAGALLGYPPAGGLPRHREAMAAWLRAHGVPADPAGVVMTAGAQHAILVALSALCRPGDEVACEELTFPGVKAACDALGLRLQPIPLDGDGLLPDRLEQLCRVRPIRAVYTIPSLHNPTSAALPAERREAVARIAQRRDVWLIEDDLLRPLLRAPGPALSALAPERTIHVSSASKALAGGLRVGFALVPAGLREAVTQALQASLIACPALNAEIVAGWIGDGTAAATVAARRRETRARQRRARLLLESCGATLRSSPESYYVWLELPPSWSADRLSREARERGVGVAPAHIFAVDERRAPNAVRLALSAPTSRRTLDVGLRTLAELLAGPAPRGTAAL